MHARGISQVNALKSELFPFLTCAICCKHAAFYFLLAFVKCTLSRQKKKSHLQVLVNIYLVANDNLILTFFFQNLGEQMALLNPQPGLFILTLCLDISFVGRKWMGSKGWKSE